MAPYRDRGYRLFVYEDASPTLSVVAETDIGFPYRFGSPVKVDRIEDIAALYADRSWQERFQFEPWEISDQRILKAVESHHGSISKPTANQLGLQVGKLRQLIIQMDLGDEVNQLRKRFKRRPVDFSDVPEGNEKWHIFERILPAGYA